ncbi:MAG: hypothetical protein KF847_15385 [Pirellulales bacterium]|nr:hypothetical protein [Pirellulales bacterium]
MDSIFALPSPFTMVVLIVAVVMGAQVITAAVAQIRRGLGHYLDLQFKREMIERGLSIDEIERLVQVRSRSLRESTATDEFAPPPRHGS